MKGATHGDGEKYTPPASPSHAAPSATSTAVPETPPRRLHTSTSQALDPLPGALWRDSSGGGSPKAGPSRSRFAALGASPGRSRLGRIADSLTPGRSHAAAADLGSYRLDAIDEQHSLQYDFASTASPVRKRVRAVTKHPLGEQDGSGKFRDLRGDDDDGGIVEAPGYPFERRAPTSSSAHEDDAGSIHPPSFVESQFATIIRRQRKRRVFSPAQILDADDGVRAARGRDVEANRGQSSDPVESVESDPPMTVADRKGLQLKAGSASAFPTNREEPMMAADQAWQFAGWGSISLLELGPDGGGSDSASEGDKRSEQQRLGQWRAAAIAGNAVTGSVFYALPAVVAAASVLSPISLLIACLLLHPFRYIICELASALSASDAGNYSYFLNVSTKTVSLLAAAATMLDAIATASVSAGTASAYIAAEAAGSPDGGGSSHAVLDDKVIAVLLLVGLAALCLGGLRDSSTLALTMFSIHIGAMVALLVAGTVAWARHGNGILAANWAQGMATLASGGKGKGVARALFDGVCVAFVGLTGFECSPSYVSAVAPGQFPKALRNLHLIVLVIEAPLMLLVLANLPLETVLGGANVLALLGQVSAAGGGEWLKLLIVIDASLVLCGGIITGAIAFSGLMDALGRDLVVPTVFLRRLPRTGAPYLSLALFLGLSILMSATCGFDLTTLSSVFSVAFLCIMTLFGIALVLLKRERPSLPRSPICSLWTVLLGISIGLIAMGGNFALSPVILTQTLGYFSVLAVPLLVLARQVRLGKMALWLLSHFPPLPLPLFLSSATTGGRWSGRGWTTRISKLLIRALRQRLRHPVIYFTSTDDISILVQALRYIEEEEETQICKLVHVYPSIDSIPEQLDETFQLVDEIFPKITVDLVLVEAERFDPKTVERIAERLGVERGRCFISTPSGRGDVAGRWRLEEYGGVRIVLP